MPERAQDRARSRRPRRAVPAPAAEVSCSDPAAPAGAALPLRPADADGQASPGTSVPATTAPLTTGAQRDAAALSLLTGGTLEVEGRLVVASNATLYCTVRDGAREAHCVYKPVAGERPLWDFPAGSLAGREVAAYQVSVAAGWHLVPPTVYRDGPFGPGMCQLWIESDETVDVIALARSQDNAALRCMAVFDAVVNNADRKIGHLLPDRDGNLFGCDHGVCFSEDYKLRTVLWQWRGRKLPMTAVGALRRLQRALTDGDLGAELGKWLSPGEVEATRQRIDLLLEHRVHPFPPDDWPAVPWPPV
jgi:uncharacterized repeat protein (TIGR03843 family)